eukprot:CAMPEP_0196755824 /NCGR_PEP_ID=MMETSP1091-20130531/98843_1 /TAXON_ID=302021 /ORGANISM="Rhodomonas sp., Strain CCMP768" /LENGTH=75 /DNA_ID=CAMNT_0042104323 /DNA_START=122 /DNA_END=349 /DNA_ORIENTATION=+
MCAQFGEKAVDGNAADAMAEGSGSLKLDAWSFWRGWKSSPGSLPHGSQLHPSLLFGSSSFGSWSAEQVATIMMVM